MRCFAAGVGFSKSVVQCACFGSRVLEKKYFRFFWQNFIFDQVDGIYRISLQTRELKFPVLIVPEM